MPRKLQFRLSPRLTEVMAHVGSDIRLARKRRRLTMAMVAERAGMTRVTLYKIERGDPAVTAGAYASVLFALGLEQQLERLAADDPLGRKLQDVAMGERVVPRRSRRASPPPAGEP
ncbi:MAG TPA: helix-turn-helix transcriptional regulator [Chloroflexota bacterium]|nr:helix-turn-helix transcriptional regulator [Chloroflexota bacterium]